VDTKSELSLAALQLFSKQGYDAIGVQEIVDAVSVTKPTLYHYFGSKRGVLAHVLASGFSPLEQQLTNACRYAGDLTGTLQKMARCYFSFIEQNRMFFQLWVSVMNAPIHSESKLCAQPLLDRQFILIKGVFLSAETDHGNMKGRADVYTVSFLGLLNSISGLILADQIVLDEGFLYHVLHQFEHGIYS
jgi:TetR/AcrR family transcriptional regulator